MDIDSLIEQLRRGEPSAGPVLVSLIAPRLMGYVAQIAPHLSPADHEQIVEDAIEEAVTKIDRYDPARGTFPAWTRTFVRYAALRWYRAHPDGPPLELTDEVLEVVANSASAVDHDVDDDNSTTRRASAALTALVLSEPEPSQLLLRLRFAEQLTHEEIAKRLEVSPAACRKRLERVLRRLRDIAVNEPDLDHLGGDR
jgi:RNA polymerase sigma-70 factor (ECF subfamily)